jgi:hypothetical protein
MGIVNSTLNTNQKEECLICWEEIDNIHLVRCIICNIQLHTYCEETYRDGKGYCKCPHCQQVGTLGVSETVLKSRNKD